MRLWTEKVYALLRAEGGCVSYIRALEEGMRFVPPGPACREGAAKKQTDARWRNFGVDVEVDLSDISQLVRNGARQIVIQALRTEIRAGRLQKTQDADGRKWLSLGEHTFG